MASIRVVAEDGVTQKVYSLAISKPDLDSADLYKLTLGSIALDFDPQTLAYDLTAYGNASAPLTAIAAQAGATITYETPSLYEVTTQSAINGVTVPFFNLGTAADKDLTNVITVTVTSPNGENTKEYILTVNVLDEVYLSDIPWVSGAAGDTSFNSGVPLLDQSWESNKGSNGRRPIKLIASDGTNAVEFTKGIGTHANSSIVYDLSGMAFTTLTGQIGVSHYQQGNGNPNLRFEILRDGKSEFVREGMTGTTPGEAIGTGGHGISVAGTNTLELKVTQPNNIWNAHANWADIKLSTSIPLISDEAIPAKAISFEHSEGHTIYTNQDLDGKPHTVELHPVYKPIGAGLGHGADVTWDSDDDSVATVASGLVIAVAVGEVNITATAQNGVVATCPITVKKVLEPSSTRVWLPDTPKFGVEITVDGTGISAGALPDALENDLTFSWYRGDTVSEADKIAGASTDKYTPVEADIGHKLTVRVVASGLYEGSTTATTANPVAKADGHPIDETLEAVDCTTLDNNDGQITGLIADHEYEYQRRDLGASPWSAWTPVEAGSTALTGLTPGSYRIRHVGSATRDPGDPSQPLTVLPHEATAYVLWVDNRLTGGAVTLGDSEVVENSTGVFWVKTEEGYLLKDLTAIYTDADFNTHPVDLEEGPVEEDGQRYTFTMPAGDVSIHVVFELKTFTISHDLDHITCDQAEHDHKVSYTTGNYVITLTPDEGYEMPASVTVSPASIRFAYEASQTDPAARVLTIRSGVTSDITISGAATLKTYTVVYNLTSGLTVPGAAQTVKHGQDFTVTLTAARGYALPDAVTVAVGGVELTGDQYEYDAETGRVTVPGVDADENTVINGTVTVTAQGVAQAIGLQTVTLVGPARAGRTLTADTVPVQATVTYQWILVDEDGAEADIEGATGKNFVIPADAEGKTIKVRVTGTGGYTGELTSDPTATIQAAAAEFIYVTGITLDSTEATVQVGKSVTISAAVTPDDATAPALSWASDNEAIATVDQNGKVTGVAEGTVTISAASTDTALGQRQFAYCTVTVTAAPSSSNTSRPTSGSSSAPATTVETRADGTVVTTVTNSDGSVTKTSIDPDGIKTVFDDSGRSV
ncbi:MAG: NPCBM/NEW2 domain-containing protein, partial [Roseburia sp.]|nr:NPCBM/NEW2 domain-containing protein [Roseburia sp.]